MRLAPMFLVCLVLSGCGGTIVPPGPPARPGQRLTGWTEDLKIAPGKEIFIRNNTDQTWRITSIVLMECENIRGGCSARDPKVTLGPYEWRRIQSVRPDLTGRSYYFRWRYNYSGIRGAEDTPAEPAFSDWRPLPDLESYGGAVGAFEVAPDERYGLTGQYSGRLALVGDTLVVRVDKGIFRNRLGPGEPVQRLRRIRVGLRKGLPGNQNRGVVYGPREELVVDLKPGDEALIVPMDLRVVLDLSGTEPIQLFFAHDIQLPGEVWGYSFSYLRGDLRDFLKR